MIHIGLEASAAQTCLLLHVDIPVIDSTKPEELEGTTQLPQNQLELLGKLSSQTGKLCNFGSSANIEVGIRLFIIAAASSHVLRSYQKPFEQRSP